MTVLVILLWVTHRCIFSLAYLLIGEAFLKAKFTVKKWLLGSAMIFVILVVDYLMGMKAHVIFILLSYILYSHYFYQQTWGKVWQGTVVLLVLGEIAEVLLILISRRLFTAEEQEAFNNADLLQWSTLKLNYVAALIMLAIACICAFGKRKHSKIEHFLLHIPMWMRLSVALAGIVLLGLWYWNTSDLQVFGDTKGIFVVIVTLFLLFSLIISIACDIEQIRLEKRNRLLGASQESIASFLFDMRAFRHNLANMLYGWQGVVQGGDIDRIREYNAEMNSTFSMINNENAQNLQKFYNEGVRRLLSEKLKSAELASVPSFLFVEDAYNHFSMKESDLCMVLGILTDNAIHAASTCKSPTIHIHVFKDEDGIHFLVRNTATDNLIESMSAGKDQGEKEIDYTSLHGIGLQSAREIVNRYPKAELFIYTRGRYVEASLKLPG